MSKMTREEYDKLQSSKYVQSLSKSGFRVVLTPHFEIDKSMTYDEKKQIEKDNEAIEFDTLDSVNIQASSAISSYPIVNGDSISDHMSRQPSTVSLSGTFSLAGNKPTTFNGQSDRLTNIETLFEKIKNQGVMCSIVTMQRGNSTNSKQRFKTRDNLVLTNITWTEGQISLGFSLSFQEAMTVSVNREPTIDYNDENLPDITDATTLNFTDEFLDDSTVLQTINSILEDNGLLDNNALRKIASYSNDIIIGQAKGVGAGLVTGALTTAAIGIATFIAGFSLTGVGAVIIFTVGFIVGGIVALWKYWQKRDAERKFMLQAFEDYSDPDKASQEAIRYANYVGSIKEQLDSLNDYIQVYGISSNAPQECMLYTDNTYVVFTFKKNNTQTTDSKSVWSCHIENDSGEIKKDINDIGSEAKETIVDCNNSNYLFRTLGEHYYVYLANKNLIDIASRSYNSNQERKQAIQNCKNDLSNYLIVVSQISLDNFSQTLYDIIIGAMTR